MVNRRKMPSTSSSIDTLGQTIREFQRRRVLSAMVSTAARDGLASANVGRVTAAARVSRHTFYELFEDRNHCFNAAFQDSVEQIARPVQAAFEKGETWRERLRAALAVLLEILDQEPEVARLCFVEAPATPETAAARLCLLRKLETAIQAMAGNQNPMPAPLAAEAAIAGAAAIIHRHIVESPRVSPVSLLNPLMAVLVLPLAGASEAKRELSKPWPAATLRRLAIPRPDPKLDMRVTYRTLRVLNAIEENPGISNRRAAELAGIIDQGQISKLLARLKKLGLIANRGQGQSVGATNAWRLTRTGEDFQRSASRLSRLESPMHAGLRPPASGSARAPRPERAAH
jgi:AcrR family transcriptional regulator